MAQSQASVVVGKSVGFSYSRHAHAVQIPVMAL